MYTDVSLELGREDHALELPWTSPDGRQRYLNLKSQPELLLEVTEAAYNRDLADFLVAMNAPHSAVETAKCDTWLSDDIPPEEEIFGAPWKFGSYVDLVFTAEASRASLPLHEKFANEVAGLLGKAPDFPASAEFIVRRCYFHSSSTMDASAALDSTDGYCVTVYVSGFGDDESGATKNWVIGLKVVQNALIQWLARNVVGE